MKYLLIITFSILLSVFSMVQLNKNGAIDRSIAEISDAIYADEPGPRVNPLIDNHNALKARYDVWNNPNANFFFMSTFEFEEGSVGLAQIEWAAKRAREGKIVHIVIDDAGHGLSDEIILYMLDSGVNVHQWSPKFSVKGIKHRFGLNRAAGKGYIKAAFQSVFRQATFRMHDKILFNNAVTSEAQKLLGSQENVGQLILGGRNAVDGHYSLDMKRVETEIQEIMTVNGKKIKRTVINSNPRKGIEHEVLVHSARAHAEAKSYITDLIGSRFTEEVNRNKLIKRMEKAQSFRKKYGKFWKSTIIRMNLESNDGFLNFSADISRWLSRTDSLGVRLDSADLARKQAELFMDILDKHAKQMTSLIDKKQISPHFFVDTFSGVLEKDFVGGLRKLAKDVDSGKLAAHEFYLAVQEVTKVQKDNFAASLSSVKARGNSLPVLRGFAGPFESNKKFSVKIAEFFAKIFGVGFNLKKYENISKVMERNEDYLFNNIIQKKTKNWVRMATPVDDVRFVHDTVDDSLMEKRVMYAAWDMISGAKGDIVFNSQYGTPTPRAFNAMDNFLKFNSAIFRLRDQEVSKGGVGLTDDATDNFIDIFVKLIKANEVNISEGLKGNPTFNGKDMRLRTQKNIKRRKEFMNNFKHLLRGDGRSKFGGIASQYIKGNVTEEIFTKKLMTFVEENRESFKAMLKKDKDIFKDYMIKLRGFIDDDPELLLGEFKPNRLTFMTNDKKSWSVGADSFIHDDFHIAQEQTWIDLGRGVNVNGYNGPGRIHSKILTTNEQALIWSANLDYRSDYINTEVGAMITAKRRGKSVIQKYTDHLNTYVNTGTKYIVNGRFQRDTSCNGVMRTFLVKNILRKQL